MKKIITFAVFILLLLNLLTGCSTESPKEPPKITIIIGDKQIDYIVAKNEWNGAIYDREDTFHTLMKENSAEDIPYVEIGEFAVIGFESKPPDKLVVMDVLIHENGDEIYSYKEMIDVPVEYKNDKYFLEIKKHPASALSSYYVENKIDIRGFRMVASWGQNECEYAFAIKTDGF